MSMAKGRASIWSRSIYRSPTMCRPVGWKRAWYRRNLRKWPSRHATKNEMFDPAAIIVGLEIGTSKICAVVGEINPAGALNIIGLGQARSRGVRKGEIADAS